MKLNKLVLVFLVLISTLFALPAKAEELPSIDIIQSQDGKIRISSDSEAAITGFVSLTITKETGEVVIMPEDVTVEGNDLFFQDLDLNGTFAYVYVFNEDGGDITIPGNVLLSSAVIQETTVYSEGTSLDRAAPDTPDIYHSGLDNKLLIDVWAEEDSMKFEVLYSTKKNGVYKAVTEYNYDTGSETDPYTGITYYHSLWSGYIKTKVGKKYYIKARGYVEVAGVPNYSKWDNISVKIKKGPIKNLVATLTAPNKLKVSWSKAKNAKKYDLNVFGYATGTKAIYDAFVAGGGSPDDFPWYLHEEDIGSAYSKKRSFTYKLNGIDMNTSMTAELELLGSETTVSYYYKTIVNDEFCRQVLNVNATTGASGNEVVFTFKPGVNLSSYDLKRYGHGGVFGTSIQSLEKRQAAKISKLNKATREDGTPLDKMTTVGETSECLYDFNLFVATKPNGTYKRVKTTADFSNPTNLKLIYKAKPGKKLYYKILPTVESIDWEAYWYPELYDASNVSYYVNLVEPITVVDYQLPK